MNPIDGTERLVGALAPLLLDLAVKGSLILAAGGGIALLLRRASAATRHLVWSLALTGLLGLPALALVLPAWHLPLPPRVSTPAVFSKADDRLRTPQPPVPPAREEPLVGGQATAASLANSGTRTPLLPAPDLLPEERPAPASAVASALTLEDWLLLVWAVGAALAVIPLGLGLVSLWRLGRSAIRLTEGTAPTMLQALRQEQGLKRPVRLLQSSKRSMPMTWGVWRPVILLPNESAHWSRERLRAVLLHELAHVGRGDCLTQLLAHLARALHWFNPLAWVAVRQLQIEQERACDDLVLNAGMNASDYAVHLLVLTSGLRTGMCGAPVTLAMSTASRVEQRVLALLDATQNHRPLHRTWVGLLTLTALGLLVPLASCALPSAASAEPEPGAAAPPPPSAEKVHAQAKLLEDLRAKLLERYVNRLDESAMLEGAIKGMLEALHDPYTDYLNPEKLAEMEQQIRGTLTGIGVQLGKKDQRITVVTPLQDSPALKAGVQAGDLILDIDGQPTTGLDIRAAVGRILGREGTIVKLKVRHPDGQEAELAITRSPIKLETIRGFRRGSDTRWDFLLDAKHKIGYVHISQINDSTPKEVREAIRQLQNKGVQGLILDLRFCPGGLMSAAVEIANLFLSGGTIVSTGKDQKIDQTWKADPAKAVATFPLVVLVNDYTASAAEIVAGALKDNDRAILVGSRTYGKGSVQELIKLSDGSGALRLTTTYYHLPSGRIVHKRPGEKTWGVDPSDGYFLAMPSEQVRAMQQFRQQQEVLGKKPPEQPRRETPIIPRFLEEQAADPQLAAALKTLIARLATGAFVKVGKSNAALATHLQQREEARNRRASLQESLQKIDQELAELEKTIKEAEKPEAPRDR